LLILSFELRDFTISGPPSYSGKFPQREFTAGTHNLKGEAFRRIFECLASGILLPGSPGVHDPCEKEPTDASGNLGEQEKEDITAFAQNALRLMAFRQIHLVLEMEALPMPRFKRFKSEAGNRKRRRDETGAEIEGDGADGVDGKKDKKEEGKMETA